MRIFPVLLDSRPAYLGGRGRSGSLLLCPLGTNVLVEHLSHWLRPVTTHTPLVVSQGPTEADYVRWITEGSPGAEVLAAPQDVADVVTTYEMSDALLIVDPRCLPRRAHEFSSLVERYCEVFGSWPK